MIFSMEKITGVMEKITGVDFVKELSGHRWKKLPTDSGNNYRQTGNKRPENGKNYRVIGFKRNLIGFNKGVLAHTFRQRINK